MLLWLYGKISRDSLELSDATAEYAPGSAVVSDAVRRIDGVIVHAPLDCHPTGRVRVRLPFPMESEICEKV